MTQTTKIQRPPIARQCQACLYYPNDCGYWDVAYREANSGSGFLSATAKHNCQDYKKREALEALGLTRELD